MTARLLLIPAAYDFDRPTSLRARFQERSRILASLESAIFQSYLQYYTQIEHNIFLFDIYKYMPVYF